MKQSMDLTKKREEFFGEFTEDYRFPLDSKFKIRKTIDLDEVWQRTEELAKEAYKEGYNECLRGQGVPEDIIGGYQPS